MEVHDRLGEGGEVPQHGNPEHRGAEDGEELQEHAPPGRGGRGSVVGDAGKQQLESFRYFARAHSHGGRALAKAEKRVSPMMLETHQRRLKYWVQSLTPEMALGRPE